MDFFDGRRPMVWVLAPFLVRDGKLVGESYDNEQTKAEVAAAFHAMGLPWVWQPMVPGSVGDVVAQIAKFREKNDAVVFNFCDGDDVNGYPGVSVLHALEAAGIPYTGAAPEFYEISTSKVVMKKVMQAAGVSTAPFAVLPRTGPVKGVCARLGVPLLVKPAVSAEGWGLMLRSVVHSDREITACRRLLMRGELGPYFEHDTIFVERFLDGPEYTVFVCGDHDRPEEIWTLPPVERVFDPAIPPEQRMLCDEQFGTPFYHDEACPPELRDRLTDLGRSAYCAVRGSGYGRVDIRMDGRSGELFVLEVNANPGLSGDPAVVSVGRMLQLAGMSFADLLARIIGHALRRTAAETAIGVMAGVR